MLIPLTAFVERHIYTISACLSLAVSLWLLATGDIISRDGTLYIETARAFLDDGIGSAFKLWGWPFYSIAIAGVHKISGLELESAAYLLTVLLETATCLAFIRLYSIIAVDGSRRWVALLFFLSFATVNHLRADIIRDYGFWAFTLIAAYQFIRYCQYQRTTNAIAWQLAILCAALFRPEAIVFAVFMPLYYLGTQTLPIAQRLRHIAVLSLISGSIVLLALAAVLSSQLSGDGTALYMPPQAGYFSPLSVFESFNTASSNFVTYVLIHDHSTSYSKVILLTGLLCMLLLELTKNLTLVYTAILLAGIRYRWVRMSHEAHIIGLFSLVAFGILAMFTISEMFVSRRYNVLLLLFVSLFVCQYLDYLFSRLKTVGKLRWRNLLFAFMAGQFLIGTISVGAHKAPIKQSSSWLLEYSEPGSIIACNDARFAYYTRQNCKLNNDRLLKSYHHRDIRHLKRTKRSYLVLWVDHRNTEMREGLMGDRNLQLLRSFENNRKDEALVFRILYREPSKSNIQGTKNPSSVIEKPLPISPTSP